MAASRSLIFKYLAERTPGEARGTGKGRRGRGRREQELEEELEDEVEDELKRQEELVKKEKLEKGKEDAERVQAQLISAESIRKAHGCGADRLACWETISTLDCLRKEPLE